MDLIELSGNLVNLLQGTNFVYLRTVPEVPDYTINSNFLLVLSSKNGTLSYEVTPQNILEVVGMLDCTVFEEDVILITWNIKSFASYFKFYSKKYLNPKNSKFYDLKIIENFHNLRENAPENLNQSIDRLKRVHKNLPKIYHSIHLKLALKLLPSIESYPLTNELVRRPEYPFYEIEGQANGRLNCVKKLSKSYSPHHLSSEIKAILKPRINTDCRFVYADYSFCEAAVLQWLSGDRLIKSIIESGADLYEKIYQIISGQKCESEENRKISKKLFLPVMYGLGPKQLSENIKISENLSKEVIKHIRHHFKDAYDWLTSQQEMAKQGPVVDYFGRSRVYESSSAYLCRNFLVQAAAATFCQEKLILLHEEIENNYLGDANICFSVHDGYGLVCNTKKCPEIYKTIKNTCTSESILCPGLKLNMNIQFGARLNHMKTFWKD